MNCHPRLTSLVVVFLLDWALAGIERQATNLRLAQFRPLSHPKQFFDIKMAATRSFLLMFLCIASSDFGVISVDAATASLIGNFTVNGLTTPVTVNLGDMVAFVCSKLDTVDNPKWALQATTSGTYILGGPSFSVTARSISDTVAATCAMNDVIACIATDSAGNTDTKTVQVKVQSASCTGSGTGASSATPGASNATPGNGVEVQARLSVIWLVVTWISSLQMLLM
ncbi:unnamed protein product [Lymnaea stagnalis]|uniref:Ig-like domain-containing protein n=1 Tax=Lymnaea stagnalis TaxID=6523 RepID=A0AAV2IA25_LYMST